MNLKTNKIGRTISLLPDYDTLKDIFDRGLVKLCENLDDSSEDNTIFRNIEYAIYDHVIQVKASIKIVAAITHLKALFGSTMTHSYHHRSFFPEFPIYTIGKDRSVYLYLIFSEFILGEVKARDNIAGEDVC
jgi:hypothetical protein